MIAASLTLSACRHKNHFEVDLPRDEQSQKYPGSPIGYLGNDLSWEDIADVKSSITHLKYFVTGAGVKEEREFASPQEASEWMLPLPAGEYDVLVAANMNKANGFSLSETAPTRAVALSLPTVYSYLDNPSFNPKQAWSGIAHVSVAADAMTTVHLDLDRLLALFTLKVKNLPEGNTIDVSIRNAADYVTLTALRAGGRYGLPSDKISADISLGHLTFANAQSEINEFKVFPTATGIEKTMLIFHIVTSEGIHLDYEGEAPAMENGKKYVLELDYNTLTPYMYITSTSINDWTDAWSFNGEVLNPQAN